jgi:putative MATE family efflux protein
LTTTDPQSDKPRRDVPFTEGSMAISPEDAPGAGTAVLDESEALGSAEGAIASGKLAGKSLGAAIWILAMPVLLQQLAAAFLGLTDKVIAGGLPKEMVVPALDGLGIGSYIGWVISIAMAGLGIGGQALIARSMGAGDHTLSHRALGQTMSLSILWGVVVGVLLWMMAPMLATMGRLTPQGVQMCVDYVRTLSYSLPFCGVMMVGSMCLFGAGETAKPSAVSIIINVFNIVFSYILSGADVSYGGRTFDNPFSFDWHVKGIAAGTALSWGLGAILILAIMRRGVQDLRLELPDLRLERSMIVRIVRLGIPNFLEGISMWAVNLFVLMFIGMIAVQSDGGEGLQGAHIIAVQWEMFSILPGFAIGTAAGALAGQYIGAGNPRMARRAVIACMSITVVLMGVVGLAYALFGEFLTRVISDEEVHLTHVPNLLLICGVTQVFFAVTIVIRQALRGAGDTTWAFIITTVSSYGVRLPLAWLFGIALGYGIEGVWIGLCGELVVRAGLFGARFLHGGWLRRKI